jgi:ketosteroid isomerase-like protein
MGGGDLRQAIVERVERYFDTWRTGDVDARRRLFAPQAVLEDPIDGVPVEGSAALEALWRRIAADGASFEPRLRRVIVAGREALAMGIVKTLPVRGAAVVTEVFASFEFDRAVEIRRLRVYRDESCTHPGQ